MTDHGQNPPIDDPWAAFLDPASTDPDVSAEERELLTRARGALARQEMWDGPTKGARERLLATVSAEPSPVRPPESSPKPSPRSRTPWLAAVGASAAAAVIAVLLISTRTSDPSGTEYEIAGGPYSPELSVQVIVDDRPNGVSFTVSLDDVPPAEIGTYYSGWVMNADGPVPIGSFHNRGGDGAVVLWSGVDIDAYPMFMVTLQDEGAPVVPSDRVVLRGSVSPDP